MASPNRTGTIEKGKQADLIVLDADPSRDVVNTEKIHLVFHYGKQVSVPAR
ncbi:MAG TPA: amidohydrolase family protein [Bryobacteraceae bacterium]|nr:amidohydrolase family protein [Bryobacteraceae bacterium]